MKDVHVKNLRGSFRYFEMMRKNLHDCGYAQKTQYVCGLKSAARMYLCVRLMQNKFVELRLKQGVNYGCGTELCENAKNRRSDHVGLMGSL